MELTSEDRATHVDALLSELVCEFTTQDTLGESGEVLNICGGG